MFTHQDLVVIGARYARNRMLCGIVFQEHKCVTTREIVDVAAYRAGVMINIEAKATRSDFLKDKTKPHRKHPERGVGHYRFYIAPVGLISPEELPPRWGLLEVTDGGKVKATVAPPLLRSLLHKSAYKTRSKEGLTPAELQTLDFFFEKCNEKGHMDYLYSAYRQLVMACEAGEPVQVSDIFQRPSSLTDNVLKFNNH